LNLVAAAVSAVSTFAVLLVLTHGLPKTDVGVFFSATSLFLLLTSVGDLGTSTGLVYFLSRARARRTLSEGAGYMRVALPPVMVVALLMAALLIGFSGPIADELSKDHAAQFRGYILVLALFIPATAILNLATAATRGLGTMRPSAVLDQILRPGLQLVLVLAAVLWAGGGLVTWAWATPYLPVAVAAWLSWKHRYRRASPEPATDAFRPVGAFWRFTAPRALAGVAQVAMQRLDIVLVGAIAGFGPAAVYTAATRFLVLGQLAAAAISKAAQPILGEAFTRDEPGAVDRLYKTSTAWLVVLTWPLYLTLIVFADTVLTVFGGGYTDGSAVLVVLSATMLLATGSGMVDMVLMMGGRTSWNLYNVLVAFTVNLTVDLWLIPRTGIIGAATGWALAILAANLLPLSQVSWSLRVHPFGRATSIAMTLSTLCFGLVPLLARLTMGAGWPALLLGCVTGGVCFSIGLWRFRGVLGLAGLVPAPSRRR
jgi:O-antigen/teichoic acid export membrane protein